LKMAAWRGFVARRTAEGASLETELIDRSVWRTHEEARVAVFDYIEIFYNRARLHSALGYVTSPDQFERRYRLSNTSEKTTAA